MIQRPKALDVLGTPSSEERLIAEDLIERDKNLNSAIRVIQLETQQPMRAREPFLGSSPTPKRSERRGLGELPDADTSWKDLILP